MQDTESRELYALILREGGKRMLYALDCSLQGEGDGGPTPFRLKASQYAEARAAIVTLFGIFERPQLEPTPARVAKNDARFQHFMLTAIRSAPSQAKLSKRTAR